MCCIKAFVVFAQIWVSTYFWCIGLNDGDVGPYVQIGNDWDKNNLWAYYVQQCKDEAISVKCDTIAYSEGDRKMLDFQVCYGLERWSFYNLLEFNF